MLTTVAVAFALAASAAPGAQPTPKKIGPPVLSGKRGSEAPGGGKGTATLNGTEVKPIHPNASTTAIPAKK